MKRIITILLALILLLCCGCTEQTVEKSPQIAKYVLALNPSVMLEDGEIISTRNSVASSMKTDIKNKGDYELYNGTPWQWISHKENGEWSQRLIREISVWDKMYCYRFSDDNTKSLAVYDTSKMNISGYDNGNINKNGIIWAFNGDEEEGICYTATQDCYMEFADRDSGSIAVVKNLFGKNVSFLDAKNTKKALYLRIYKNNRIYWQEILNEETTSVDFPSFTGIKLKAGDVIIITAQAVDKTDDIERGYCDLPADSEVITVKETITSQKLVEKEPEKITEIPLVKDKIANFAIVYPDGCSEETKRIIDDFTADIEAKLEIFPEYSTDSSVMDGDDKYYILVGKTEFAESEDALSQIKSTRKNYSADFIIKQKNNKIVITADNDYSLSYALNFFLANYAKDAKSTVPVGYEYISANYNKLVEIKLAGVDISKYRIVTSNYCSFIEAQAADYLVESILKSAGVVIKQVKDYESPAQDNEILIGYTNRTSSDYSKIANTSISDTYKINVDNGKTTILSTSASAVNAGVVDLAKRLAEKGSLGKGEYDGKYDGGYSLTGGYKLTWCDEFNGTTLSKDWKYTDPSDFELEETKMGGIIIRGAKENASVGNGELTLKSTVVGKDVRSITIQSMNKMVYKYGYAEARMKVQIEDGFHCAFWSCTKSAGIGVGEFDIFECFGEPNVIKPNLHIWDDSGHENLLGGEAELGNNSAGTSASEPYGYNYHTIGMEWTDDYIQFYVDGAPTKRIDTTNSKFDVFDQYSDIKFGAGGGGSWLETEIKNGVTESPFCIDWVRIWQKEDQKMVYKG